MSGRKRLTTGGPGGQAEHASWKAVSGGKKETSSLREHDKREESFVLRFDKGQ